MTLSYRENQVHYDELSDAKDYIVLLESRLGAWPYFLRNWLRCRLFNNIVHTPEAYQTQSLNIYRQVKNALQATEHATIQRDQAHAREKALSEEVDVLHERLKSSAGKVRHHPSHTSAFVKPFANKVTFDEFYARTHIERGARDETHAEATRSVEQRTKLCQAQNWTSGTSQLRAWSCPDQCKERKLRYYQHETSRCVSWEQDDSAPECGRQHIYVSPFHAASSDIRSTTRASNCVCRKVSSSKAEMCWRYDRIAASNQQCDGGGCSEHHKSSTGETQTCAKEPVVKTTFQVG